MRIHMLAACVAVVLGIGSTGAADIVNKPIDTEQLVVKPTAAAADLVSRTMKVIGATTAGAIEKDGFVKTFNNLFRKPTPKTSQPGGLPLPSLFPSTQYKSYNTPVMPTVGRTPGR